MEQDDQYENRDDFPQYRDEEEIQLFELTNALGSLHLLDDDPYLRMQVFNLAVVDKFITQLEYDVLRRLNEEERTPVPETAFLSAQSQMWIFAAYEILRTWRERVKDVMKLHKNGGLGLKIEALSGDLGFRHGGREIRAEQLQKVLDDPALIPKIREDLRVAHIPFARLEYIRVALAKHEVAGNKKSIAYAPGYGRISEWCGSLEYELENDGVILGKISRRDIADELRLLSDRRNPPTDDDLASFDAFMKGPPANPFSQDDTE
jgi:hypothetical protein